MSNNYSFIYGKDASKNISLKNKYQITNSRNAKHEFQSRKGSLIGKTTDLRKRSLSKKDLRKKIQSESVLKSNDGVKNKSIRGYTSVNSDFKTLNDKIDLLSVNINNLRTEVRKEIGGITNTIDKAENGIRKEIQDLGCIIKSSFEKLENLFKDVLVKKTDNNEEDKKINVNNNANNNAIETPKKIKSIVNYYKAIKTENKSIFNLDSKSFDLNYSETIKNNNSQISPNQSENGKSKIIENISSSKSKKGKRSQRFFINSNKEITDSSNSSLIDKKEKLNEYCEENKDKNDDEIANCYSIKRNNETISSIRKKYQEYKRNNGSK